MPAGSKTIKNYALGHYFVASFFQIISRKFFGLSANSGLVYTPRQPHLKFSSNLNLFTANKIRSNVKDVYALEVSKNVRFRPRNETLPKAKFQSVNQKVK